MQEAADVAAESGRLRQMKLGPSLVVFFEDQGLDIHEPDLAASRSHVQAQDVGSECAVSWPEGVLERINAPGAR